MRDSRPLLLPCPVLGRTVRVLRWVGGERSGTLVAGCSGLDECSQEAQMVAGNEVALPAERCPFRDMILECIARHRTNWPGSRSRPAT